MRNYDPLSHSHLLSSFCLLPFETKQIYPKPRPYPELAAVSWPSSLPPTTRLLPHPSATLACHRLSLPPRRVFPGRRSSTCPKMTIQDGVDLLDHIHLLRLLLLLLLLLQIHPLQRRVRARRRRRLSGRTLTAIGILLPKAAEIGERSRGRVLVPVLVLVGTDIIDTGSSVNVDDDGVLLKEILGMSIFIWIIRRMWRWNDNNE
jgi:hypothetical protein